MKADSELIDYLKVRQRMAEKGIEENEPHGDDRFKHIYYTGKESAYREIINILEAEW